MSQADWDRLQYYSRRINVFFGVDNDYNDSLIHPSTYLRIAQLQSSALFPSLRHLHYELEDSSKSHIFLFISPLLDSITLHDIGGFENTIVGPFLATLQASSPMLRRIVLNSGQMSVDTLKKSIPHFKQLRSLELSDAVFMDDFGLWEVLGTLPSLANLFLDIDPSRHPTHDPEDSNSQSGDPKYFDALETLSITGSVFLIQHLLSFIDSPYLKSLSLYPAIDLVHIQEPRNEPVDLLTPSMTIVVSKWSESLKELNIGTSPLSVVMPNGITHRNSKLLTLLSGLHEIQSFSFFGWRMENYNDALKRLAMSWPKLRDLENKIPISLSALRILAENCPDLRLLHIQLDTSTIPPFDDISTKSVRHNLEVLYVMGPGDPEDHQLDAITETMLESQIQVARHLDLIFPYLKTIEVRDKKWSGISKLVKLCQDVRRGQ